MTLNFVDGSQDRPYRQVDITVPYDDVVEVLRQAKGLPPGDYRVTLIYPNKAGANVGSVRLRGRCRKDLGGGMHLDTADADPPGHAD